METEETLLKSEMKAKIFQLFSDFMTRVTEFEELVAVGSRLLVSFQQGLEFVRRPPIDKTSELFERVIKANETKRLMSYIEAGWVNTHERVESLNKLHTSQIGLLNNLSKAKVIVDELESMVEDIRRVIESASECSSDSHHKDNGAELDPEATTYSEEETVSSDPQKSEVIDYAVMVAIIYSMVKQDYVMQEKIVSSLNLKTSSGEVESYCLMWSLRPFINDEIMHQAWRFIP